VMCLPRRLPVAVTPGPIRSRGEVSTAVEGDALDQYDQRCMLSLVMRSKAEAPCVESAIGRDLMTALETGQATTVDSMGGVSCAGDRYAGTQVIGHTRGRSEWHRSPKTRSGEQAGGSVFSSVSLANLTTGIGRA